MAPRTQPVVAQGTRSLRTISSELEFLVDIDAITQAQRSAILAQLPSEAQLQASIQQSAADTPPPANQLSNMRLNEKGHEPHSYNDPIPPPAYASGPPVLSIASALYAYTPTDAGDLALQPQDRIQVLEHMNNDWWRGRNERTRLEGIFPRTYVSVIEEKSTIHSPQPVSSYGNLPLEISHSGSSGSHKPSKFEENGKKFGKKMGNAAIFGAGATVGSKIVNGIF
ncbi:SH3 domain-containing protein [Histoplasma capsulatum H143]|uniref:SH3 domain-containing protein n=1 Tax=Ajellomyces capsulatus (strain H143) TaxID=544712 RepID=C6H465_AJECH|nr:SH3 domain-containing protein [Histoplasma capsulatum H143]